MMTAMEFVFASRATWSLSSGTCSTARIRQSLVGLESVDDG